MEDNLLGETQMNGSYLGKDAPVLTLVNENGETLTEAKENSEVRFAGADETYMELLMENGKDLCQRRKLSGTFFREVSRGGQPADL